MTNLASRLKKLLNDKSSLSNYIIYSAVIIYFILFSYLSVAKHLGLKSNIFDLGTMDQALYETTQGNFMHNSNFPYGITDTKPSIFAKHAFISLLAFVPIYYIYPNPIVLLVTQTLLIALGALPLYWLGKKVFKKNSMLSIVVPVAYLLNPMLHDANLFDFHPVVAAAPLLIFAFYFMYTKKYKTFYLLATIIALTKEDMPLIIFMFGLYMIFVQKEKVRGVLVSLFSIIYFSFAIKYFIPFFVQRDTSIFISDRYAYLGGSVSSIILTAITNPWTIFTSLLTARKLLYVVILTLPTMFLSLFSLETFLLSTPSFLINLLNKNTSMYTPFYYYYSAPILPFIFISTLFGMKRILNKSILKLKLNGSILSGIVLIPSILLSLVLSQAPYSLSSTWKEFEISEHAQTLYKVKEKLPSNASLVVQSNLAPHFTHRKEAYSFPSNVKSADYILVDVFDPNPVTRIFPNMRNFLTTTQLTPNDYYQNVVGLFNNDGYGVEYYSNDGYLLFKKGWTRHNNGVALEMFNKQFEGIQQKYNDAQINSKILMK